MMETHVFIPDGSTNGEHRRTEIVKEIRQGYLEGWLSKEDVLDALQRGRINKSEYEWILSP